MGFQQGSHATVPNHPCIVFITIVSSAFVGDLDNKNYPNKHNPQTFEK